MLHLTCSMIASVDLSRYGISHAKIGYLRIVVQARLLYIFTVCSLLCRLRSFDGFRIRTIIF